MSDDERSCWDNGEAIVDVFRKQYPDRAQNMDSFALAISDLIAYINGPIRTAIQKIEQNDSAGARQAISTPCTTCLPEPYASAFRERDKTGTDGGSVSMYDVLNPEDKQKVLKGLDYKQMSTAARTVNDRA